MLLLRDGLSDHCSFPLPHCFTWPSLCFIFLVFLPHVPPPFLVLVAFFRAMPPFFNTVCIHLKRVHVLLAFSSALAAGVSSAPEALTEIIALNAKHGRASQSTWTCQQLWLYHLEKQSPTTSVSPLSFLSPDCCRLWPSTSRQRCDPTSWHLTEAMRISEMQIKPAIIQYCWKRWDWVLWLLVAYERAILKYYCIWKTPVNTV